MTTRLICDDPHTPEPEVTPERREELRQWFTQAWVSRGMLDGTMEVVLIPNPCPGLDIKLSLALSRGIWALARLASL